MRQTTFQGHYDYVNCFMRHTHEVDIDITPQLKPGKTTIALRVLSHDEYFGANGLYERPFLYTKK